MGPTFHPLPLCHPGFSEHQCPKPYFAVVHDKIWQGRSEDTSCSLIVEERYEEPCERVGQRSSVQRSAFNIALSEASLPDRLRQRHCLPFLVLFVLPAPSSIVSFTMLAYIVPALNATFHRSVCVSSTSVILFDLFSTSSESELPTRTVSGSKTGTGTHIRHRTNPHDMHGCY